MQNKLDVNKLDHMLIKLIDEANENLDIAIKDKDLSKGLTEAICIILSVAYERATKIYEN